MPKIGLRGKIPNGYSLRHSLLVPGAKVTLAQEIQALRRRAAAYAGRWFSVGGELFDERRQRVAAARDPATAAYLAAIHNAFLPLANAWFQTRKALRDRKAMTKLLKEENK